MMTVADTYSLFGSPAGGAIISEGGYRAMQAWAAALTAIGLILGFIIRYRIAGTKLWKVV
jgi:hypothetical protein